MMVESFFSFFFFNDTATTEIYTFPYTTLFRSRSSGRKVPGALRAARRRHLLERRGAENRSEEHTSELQSPCNLVCRLLLEKKKLQQREKIILIISSQETECYSSSFC